MPDAKQYADRDHMAQGDYYLRHISAMTGEGLQLKSEIAGELAHRDMVIDAQAAEIERLRVLHAQACDMYDRKNPSGCVCKIDPVTDEVASACALHREMAEDAARYRYLRNLDWWAEPEMGLEIDGSAWRVTFSSPAPFENASGGSWLDAAIDAARKEADRG